MKRQRFSREYKLEAVKQVRERNVPSAQVARDLGIRENLVSRWVREGSGDIPLCQCDVEQLPSAI